DGVLKLLIFGAHQRFGLTRHFEQPAAVLFLIFGLVAGVAAMCQVGALNRFVVSKIEHSAAADRVGLVDGFCVGAGRARAQRGGGGGWTRSQRAEESERRPPAHSLSVILAARAPGLS